MSPRARRTKNETVMNTTKKYYIGVDVSKAKLDIYCPLKNDAITIPNSLESLAKWLNRIDSQLLEQLHVVCEASGGYEKIVVAFCHDKSVRVSSVNPSRVRYFAKGAGQMAKTDKIDAEMISRYASVHKPAPTPLLSMQQESLKALARRRVTMIGAQIKEKDQLLKERDPYVKKDIQAHLKQLVARVAKLDKAIELIILENPDLDQKRHRLMEIKGVGPVTTAMVIAELPELGQLTDKQAAALTGVAPFVRDSGKLRGRRIVQGGRSQVRRSLFMAATSASRFNPILREFYQRLRGKGKAHHLAITAVMRKLITLMNRLISDPNFELQK